jgi:hypothetical protein
MSGPGFSADASLFRTQHTYVTAGLGVGLFSSPGPAPPPLVGEAVGLSHTWWGGLAGPLVDADIYFPSIPCDKPGNPCCLRDAEVKTPHCHKSLGCNVATRRCEPCGGQGQVCCDGDFTGFSLRGYSGFLLDPQERTTTCNPGLRCDAKLAADGKTWLGTRRCQPCGTTLGGPCCAPDASYGLGRCFADAATGEPLVCSDPWKGAAGICIPCGKAAGQPACIASGQACASGLVADSHDICRPCGSPGEPMCEDGVPCRSGAVPHRFRDECVPAGGPNQPCDPTVPGGCVYKGTFCNAGKICEPCGMPGQRCCPPEASMRDYHTATGCWKPGECRDTPTGRRCAGCGFEHGPVCQHESPCQGGEPVNGWCRPCGKEGQVCCRWSASIRCDQGLICRDNACKKPGGGGAGNTEQWRTCSGESYTWSTMARPVTIEKSNGCTMVDTFVASTDEEALRCARAKWGDDAVVEHPDWFKVSLDCEYTGCRTVTLPARDRDAAEDCASSEFGGEGCEVRDLPCP